MPVSAVMGGAVWANGGTVVVGNSSFRDFEVTNGAHGAAIAAASPASLTIYNSTFINNASPVGCAVYVGTGATTNITNSTIVGNTCSADQGAIQNAGGIVTLRNTILANNTGGNCFGTITNGGNNIDLGTTCGFGSTSGSKSSTDPLLGAYADNGGPSSTIALQANSPAINAGSATSCAAALGGTTYGAGGKDQRGYSRRSGFCDIGAFEAQPATINRVSGSSQSATINAAFALPLLTKVSDANANPLGGVVVNYAVPLSGASAILASSVLVTNASGNASTTATANGTAGGAYTVTAAPNGVTAVNFSLTNTSASTTIASHFPNPSQPGQAVTASFTVTSGSGSPTGDVTVSDGTVNCTVTVATGSCTITLATAGTHTLTATYAGNANFGGSTSAGVSQTVSPTEFELLLPFTIR